MYGVVLVLYTLWGESDTIQYCPWCIKVKSSFKAWNMQWLAIKCMQIQKLKTVPKFNERGRCEYKCNRCLDTVIFKL